MIAPAALRELVASVLVTDRLAERPTSAPDYPREKLAIQDLARHMADDPASLLPELVRQAMQLCHADSGGISVLEGNVFRWQGLTGTLSCFEGTFTPRDNSPCGVCLDENRPILMANPEKAYDWIAAAGIVVPEVLLVPLSINGTVPLGTLWVVAPPGRHFNNGDARLMAELATFTGIALHMVQTDAKLKAALEQQETLAAEMSHRVKNMLATTSALIQLSMRGAATKDDLAQSLRGRIQALGLAHGLVRSSFGIDRTVTSVPLDELIATILRPYAMPMLHGPAVPLGERATNALALILHELTTNAAKYGALSATNGAVHVSWRLEKRENGERLVLDWEERGGPTPQAPAQTGFGSRLVRGTVDSLRGTIAYHWPPAGLRARIEVPTDRLAL